MYQNAIKKHRQGNIYIKCALAGIYVNYTDATRVTKAALSGMSVSNGVCAAKETLRQQHHSIERCLVQISRRITKYPFLNNSLTKM